MNNQTKPNQKASATAEVEQTEIYASVVNDNVIYGDWGKAIIVCNEKEIAVMKAAPELLKALKQWLYLLEHRTMTGAKLEDATKQARAAIAKAEGRTE